MTPIRTFTRRSPAYGFIAGCHLFRRIFLSCILLFCAGCGPLISQNVHITGTATPWYAGRAIELLTYSDLVTRHLVLESTDTISDSGTFELFTGTDYTRPVFLRVDNLEAQLYVEPGGTYSVTLPEPDESKFVNSDVVLPINAGILTTDTLELNALIFDFQRIYNKVLASGERFLNRHTIFLRADSLEQLCAARYKNVRNPYFSSYVTYRIASLNASVSRGEEYLVRRFVAGKPIQYHHAEYMAFFETCFTGYFKTISARYPGQSIFNILNVHSDYNALTAFLKRESLMRSDSLRELVILFNLWENYFSVEFNRDAVENLVSQLLLSTKNDYHAAIARQMLAFFGRLQPGSEAPDFSARARDNRIGSLGMFKGRWVYLNFFSTSNTSSLREMLKIADLKRRYGHKVVFLSVCVDDSLSTYQRYLRENPRFDWAIWYNNDPSVTTTAKQKYDVTGSEAYFLISPQGEIAQNPALAPSQGIEYRFNVMFKIRTRKPPGGLR